MLASVRAFWLLQMVAFLLATAALAEPPAEDDALPLIAPAAQKGPSASLPDDVSYRPKLIKQVARDFKNVFTTKENLWILGAGLGGSLLIHPVDDRITRSRFNAELFDSGGLDRTFESGEVIGGSLFQVGGAVTALALGKATSHPELEDLGRDLLRAQIVTQGLTQAIKHAVRRARPDDSSRTSFPSGHSSGTFATATVLQRRYGWKAGLPAYGVAGFVAASRLSENKHFLSDVVFGAAVGILVGRTVTFGVRDTRFALSPMLVPDGAGVQVSLLP